MTEGATVSWATNYLKMNFFLRNVFLYSSCLQPFGHQGPVSKKTIFPRTSLGKGDGFRMMQAQWGLCSYENLTLPLIGQEVELR